MHDGRLELDEDGHVLEGAAPTTGTPVIDLLAADPRSVGSSPRTAGARLVLACVLSAAAVGAGLLAVLGSGGVEVAVVAPDAPAAALPRTTLSGTYRIEAGTAVRGIAMSGPWVASSRVEVSEDGSLDVAATADCSDTASLDAPSAASYSVQLSTASGTTSVELPDGVVDWASALRRACWLQRSAEALDVRDIAVRREARDRWLELDLMVGNRTGRDAQARSVEFVDRAVGGAPVAVLPDGGSGTVVVRVPLARCSAGRLGAQTTVPWRVSLAVGPVGEAPQAEVAVDLSREQRREVADVVARRCG